MNAIAVIHHEATGKREFIHCSNRNCMNTKSYKYYSTQHAIDDGWRADRQKYLYCPECAGDKQ